MNKCCYCGEYTNHYFDAQNLDGEAVKIYRCLICGQKEKDVRKNHIAKLDEQIHKLEQEKWDIELVDYNIFEEKIKSLDWLKEKKFVLGDRGGEYVLCFYAKDSECHEIAKNYCGEIELMNNGEMVYLESDSSLSCDGAGFRIRSTSLDLFTKFIKTYKPKIYLDKEYVEQKIEYNKALLELCDE